MTENAVVPFATGAKKSLVEKFAGRFNLEPNKLLDILKVTAFKQKDGAVTNE